jgi:hypothetical protein
MFGLFWPLKGYVGPSIVSAGDLCFTVLLD